MAAPTPPVIRAHGSSHGEYIVVRHRPVATATDYNLYVQEAGGARGIEYQYVDDDVDADGWFHVQTGVLVGVVTVDVTALNVGAEESAASNTVQVILRGAETADPTQGLHNYKRSTSR